jgi:hypothetical protein
MGAAGAVTTWGSKDATAGRVWMAPTVAKTVMKTSEMSIPQRTACVGLPTVEGRPSMVPLRSDLRGACQRGNMGGAKTPLSTGPGGGYGGRNP